MEALADREEIPLRRRGTGTRSFASEIVEKRQVQQDQKKDYSTFYLFKRIGSLNLSGYQAYVIGTCAAMCTGWSIRHRSCLRQVPPRTLLARPRQTSSCW